MSDPSQNRHKAIAQRRGSFSMVDGHLKAELNTLHKKFDRLEQKEKRIQDLCTEWEGRPDDQKDFDAFMRSIKAVAFSSGAKFKSRVRMVGQLMAAQRQTRNRQIAATATARNKEEKIDSIVEISQKPKSQSPSPSKNSKNSKSSVCQLM